MDKMVDHLFVFEGAGVVRDFPGNYTEYRDKKEQEEKTARKEEQQVPTKKEEAPVVKEAAETVVKKKLSFKEKAEFEQLEKDIAKLEKEKATLTEQLSSGGGSSDDMMKWSERIGLVIAELDEKSLRWLELSEA
jgi:ATP-binding cassette subfamily F protein uup